MTKQNTPASIHPSQWEVIDGMAKPKNNCEKPTESDFYKRHSEGLNWGDYLSKQHKEFDQFATQHSYPAPGLKDAIYEAEQLQFVEQVKWLIEYNPDHVWRDILKGETVENLKSLDRELRTIIAITATPTEVKEPEDTEQPSCSNCKVKLWHKRELQEGDLCKPCFERKAALAPAIPLEVKFTHDELRTIKACVQVCSSSIDKGFEDNFYIKLSKQMADISKDLVTPPATPTEVKDPEERVITSKQYDSLPKEQRDLYEPHLGEYYYSSTGSKKATNRPWSEAKKYTGFCATVTHYKLIEIATPTTLLSEGNSDSAKNAHTESEGKNDFTPNDIQLYDKFVTLDSEGKQTVSEAAHTEASILLLSNTKRVQFVSGSVFGAQWQSQHTAKEIEALQARVTKLEAELGEEKRIFDFYSFFDCIKDLCKGMPLHPEAKGNYKIDTNDIQLIQSHIKEYCFLCDEPFNYPALAVIEMAEAYANYKE